MPVRSEQQNQESVPWIVEELRSAEVQERPITKQVRRASIKPCIKYVYNLVSLLKPQDEYYKEMIRYAKHTFQIKSSCISNARISTLN